MSGLPDFTQNIAKDTRYFPTLVSTLILLALLLFFDKLTEPLKNWFIPSLALYTGGTALIAYVQTMFHIRSEGEKIPDWKFNLLILLHIFWLTCFVIYNYWRGSL